jgi:Uma2 family endonuclease
MNPAVSRRITSSRQLWEAGDIGRCELVRGQLVMMTPASGEHGRVTMELGSRIASHARQHGLGAVYAAETGFLIATEPDTVRAPDCAFIAEGRVPPRGESGFVRVVPDLVAETVSPNDTASEISDKVQQWLQTGCRVMWVVDPQAKTATVCEPGGRAEVIQTGGSLTGGEVLPGFELRIAELFSP